MPPIGQPSFGDVTPRLIKNLQQLRGGRKRVRRCRATTTAAAASSLSQPPSMLELPTLPHDVYTPNNPNGIGQQYEFAANGRVGSLLESSSFSSSSIDGTESGMATISAQTPSVIGTAMRTLNPSPRYGNAMVPTTGDFWTGLQSSSAELATTMLSQLLDGNDDCNTIDMEIDDACNGFVKSNDETACVDDFSIEQNLSMFYNSTKLSTATSAYFSQFNPTSPAEAVAATVPAASSSSSSTAAATTVDATPPTATAPKSMFSVNEIPSPLRANFAGVAPQPANGEQLEQVELESGLIDSLCSVADTGLSNSPGSVQRDSLPPEIPLPPPPSLFREQPPIDLLSTMHDILKIYNIDPVLSPSFENNGGGDDGEDDDDDDDRFAEKPSTNTSTTLDDDADVSLQTPADSAAFAADPPSMPQPSQLDVVAASTSLSPATDRPTGRIASSSLSSPQPQCQASFSQIVHDDRGDRAERSSSTENTQPNDHDECFGVSLIAAIANQTAMILTNANAPIVGTLATTSSTCSTGAVLPVSSSVLSSSSTTTTIATSSSTQHLIPHSCSLSSSLLSASSPSSVTSSSLSSSSGSPAVTESLSSSVAAASSSMVAFLSPTMVRNDDTVNDNNDIIAITSVENESLKLPSQPLERKRKRVRFSDGEKNQQQRDIAIVDSIDNDDDDDNNTATPMLAKKPRVGDVLASAQKRQSMLSKSRSRRRSARQRLDGGQTRVIGTFSNTDTAASENAAMFVKPQTTTMMDSRYWKKRIQNRSTSSVGVVRANDANNSASVISIDNDNTATATIATTTTTTATTTVSNNDNNNDVSRSSIALSSPRLAPATSGRSLLKRLHGKSIVRGITLSSAIPRVSQKRSASSSATVVTTTTATATTDRSLSSISSSEESEMEFSTMPLNTRAKLHRVYGTTNLPNRDGGTVNDDDDDDDDTAATVTVTDDLHSLGDRLQHHAADFLTAVDLNAVHDNLYDRHVRFLQHNNLTAAKCRAMRKVLRHDRYRIEQITTLLNNMVWLVYQYYLAEHQTAKRLLLKYLDHAGEKLTKQNIPTADELANDPVFQGLCAHATRRMKKTLPRTGIEAIDQDVFNYLQTTRRLLNEDSPRSVFNLKYNERELINSMNLYREQDGGIFPKRTLLLPTKQYVRTYLYRVLHCNLEANKTTGDGSTVNNASGIATGCTDIELPVTSSHKQKEKDLVASSTTTMTTTTTAAAAAAAATTTITGLSSAVVAKPRHSSRRPTVLSWRQEYKRFYYVVNFLSIINYKFGLFIHHCDTLEEKLAKQTGGTACSSRAVGFKLLPSSYWSQNSNPDASSGMAYRFYSVVTEKLDTLSLLEIAQPSPSVAPTNIVRNDVVDEPLPNEIVAEAVPMVALPVTAATDIQSLLVKQMEMVKLLIEDADAAAVVDAPPASPLPATPRRRNDEFTRLERRVLRLFFLGLNVQQKQRLLTSVESIEYLFSTIEEAYNTVLGTTERKLDRTVLLQLAAATTAVSSSPDRR